MSCSHIVDFRRHLQRNSVGRVKTSPRAGRAGLGVIVDKKASVGLDEVLEDFDTLVRTAHNVEDAGLNQTSEQADQYVIVCEACSEGAED